MRPRGFCGAAVLTGTLAMAWSAQAAAPPRALYARALAGERAVRDAENGPTLAQLRHAVAAYEAIVRRYPASGYSDNALWQAGNLALLAFERFGQTADRRTAARLLNRLTSQYPSSSLVAGVKGALRQVHSARPPDAAAAEGLPPRPKAPVESDSKPRPVAASTPATSAAVLTEIHRSLLPDGVRVTLDLDNEVTYHEEQLARPRRIFFDLKGVRTTAALQDATLKFDDDVVREIRLGRHPQNTTRIVLDLDGVDAYSAYSLYNPYRLVIDFHRSAAAKAGQPSGPVASGPPARTAAATAPLPAPPLVASLPAPPLTPARVEQIVPPAPLRGPDADGGSALLASTQPAPQAMVFPSAPAANSDGKFSLARQLGLGVSRIVIDAGHGGHDPGAHGNGVNEAELTLDVAVRLQKLLEKVPGVEVVMTRDTDVFVPLQERTAIANREGADLFLSIHANASRNPKAHGIETYFLNFATNREAEAVAARENSSSGQAMHSLPDIVRAIALNNKINESRDLAATVQKSMVRRLAARNRQLKDLGVKQAPFVVLIGATMPSVLAEISFVTYKQEGQLLKTGAYRQQIADALLDAIVRYQQGLKKMNSVAAKGTFY